MTGKNGTPTRNLDEFFTNRLVPAGIAQERARVRLMAMQTGTFLNTGIDCLDRRLRLMPTEVVFVAGRAGTGKTAFGMQMVSNAQRFIVKNKESSSVAVFSAEMSADSLMLREAAAITNTSVERLGLGQATPEEYEEVERVLRKLRYDNVFIDESSAPTLEHMVEQLQALQDASPLRLVLFDYMELAGEFGQNQSDRMAKIGRGLKAIARRFEVPVVVLAQLNREIEKRQDKRPLLSDIMHGGEQSADIILALHRPHLYDKAQPAALVEAHIVKYRNGRTGVENLFFNSQTLRFSGAYIQRENFNA